MIATISSNKRFVQVTPVPVKDIYNGLRIWISFNNNSNMSVIVKDIEKGKSRYYLSEQIGKIAIECEVEEQIEDKIRKITIEECISRLFIEENPFFNPKTAKEIKEIKKFLKYNKYKNMPM